MLEDDPQIFAYRRVYKDEELLVVNNFYDTNANINLEDIKGYQVLLSNYPNSTIMKHMVLRPYESCVFYRKK